MNILYINKQPIDDEMEDLSDLTVDLIKKIKNFKPKKMDQIRKSREYFDKN